MTFSIDDSEDQKEQTEFPPIVFNVLKYLPAAHANKIRIKMTFPNPKGMTSDVIRKWKEVIPILQKQQREIYDSNTHQKLISKIIVGYLEQKNQYVIIPVPSSGKIFPESIGACDDAQEVEKGIRFLRWVNDQ